MTNGKILIIVGVFATCVAIVIIAELLYIAFSARPVAVPAIPRNTQIYGKGPEIVYAVIGDSTGVAQGATYDTGIAKGTAQLIATQHTVNMTNFAVSGATMREVLQQAQKAAHIKPDIVLVAAGANDVTRFTSRQSVKGDTLAIIATLRASNPYVRILLTGSPQMGSIPRFPWPINAFARLRSAQLNATFDEIVQNHEDILRAPLAEKTGDIFSRRPELFAQDNFHPNDKGYAVWVPVLNTALKKLLEK